MTIDAGKFGRARIYFDTADQLPRYFLAYVLQRPCHRQHHDRVGVYNLLSGPTGMTVSPQPGDPSIGVVSWTPGG